MIVQLVVGVGMVAAAGVSLVTGHMKGASQRLAEEYEKEGMNKASAHPNSFTEEAANILSMFYSRERNNRKNKE